MSKHPARLGVQGAATARPQHKTFSARPSTRKQALCDCSTNAQQHQVTPWSEHATILCLLAPAYRAWPLFSMRSRPTGAGP